MTTAQDQHEREDAEKHIPIFATLYTDLPSPKTISYAYQKGVVDAQLRLGWLQENMLLPNCLFHIAPFEDARKAFLALEQEEQNLEVQTGPIAPTLPDNIDDDGVTDDIAYAMDYEKHYQDPSPRHPRMVAALGPEALPDDFDAPLPSLERLMREYPPVPLDSELQFVDEFGNPVMLSDDDDEDYEEKGDIGEHDF